jgi:ribosome-associated protein
MIRVTPNLTIPPNEVRFETSTSSGPGGQHVNRSQTRVTLLFDVNASQALSDHQKRRVLERLSSRVDRVGRVRVRCGRHRSQAANREETMQRFAALLREALRRRESRVATRPSRTERKRRLEQKRRRAGVKRQRRRPAGEDD